MALTYNRQVRTLGIRGVITLTSGAQVNLTSEDVLYYSISESCGEDGLPLGTAEAASFELTISNVGKGYTPDQFDNAEVHMQIGIETDGAIAYSDFGVWYVCEVNAPEQSVSIDLSGYDALATLFEVDYTDSEGAYPTSLGSLATAICAAAGVSLKSNSFSNAGIQISKMPEWGESTTLRSIIGFISACAGGFAHIDRSGRLEIISYNSGSEYEINTDLYTALTRTNGTSFSFNALQVKFIDSEDDAYTRYALQTSIVDNPTNTIRIENNPLFTEGIANSVVTVLTGVSANPASVSWVGDPSVKLGDVLIVNNMAGYRVRLIVNSQSFSFSGGLNADSACTLPALNTINGSSYTSSGNIMDGNGNIKATRITNLDKTIVSATTGHFENLDAESIKTDTLLASIIDAVILKAQNISTESVETDKLTSAIAEIVNATIRKLNAGTITTDELYASYAELFRLKTDSITADNILTDALAAELARITVLTAGTASFDKATVQHLVAQAMNLEYGVAGQVFIKNLAVEYAQMVGAAIGNLCIKASDGNYYQIDVRPDGTVSAVKTTVSAGEIAAGQTDGGRVILETNITAANLNAGNLLATYALVNKIDAARIDVDALFAREAFISALNTSKIFGGNSLEIIVGKANGAARIFRQEEFPDGTAEVKPGDMLVKPSTGQQYQAVQSGAISFAMDADGGLYYEYDGDGSLSVDGFDLYADGFVLPVDERGEVTGVPYVWELVQDGVLAQAIAEQAESMAATVLQINKDIANLQEQIDGNITTWFDSHIPTSTNAPAKDWTTDELKNQHLGDLFYVDNADLEENGYCYRWQQTNGVYGWVLLEDAGVTKALAAAAAAQDTADGKRRVFISTPVPPYDAGDLWVQGSGGDIMRCATAKSKGQSYASADWVKASKYTDDTAANKAQSAANNAQSTANAAQSAADTAQGTADAASNYANEALDIANAALSRADFQRVVRIDDAGLHVGDNLTDYEVLLDSASVNVVAAGVRVSTFSDKFIRLDNMQIRKVRGGLAISVYNG